MVALGQKFGRLTVLSYAGSTKNRQRKWTCVCDCGGSATVRTDGLTSGRAQSCGCRQKEAVTAVCKSRTKHGLCRDRIYVSWVHMIERCTNPKNGRFDDYGGRGVTVCERWRSFENFHADMGDMPEGRTLERSNNSKGYEPGNCYWATYTEQNRNRRNSIYIATEYGAVHLKEYCEISGVAYANAKRYFDSGRLPGVRLGAE